jgi:hypothetical protein
VKGAGRWWGRSGCFGRTTAAPTPTPTPTPTPRRHPSRPSLALALAPGLTPTLALVLIPTLTLALARQAFAREKEAALQSHREALDGALVRQLREVREAVAQRTGWAPADVDLVLPSRTGLQ